MTEQVTNVLLSIFIGIGFAVLFGKICKNGDYVVVDKLKLKRNKQFDTKKLFTTSHSCYKLQKGACL